MIATRKRHQLSPLQLQLTQRRIERVQAHRVLVVTIDYEMEGQSHLNNLCKAVSKIVFLLSQLRHYVNAKTYKLFYSAHILAHIKQYFYRLERSQ